MKKSVDILGLPIISITEGRELGVSKSLLMDAQSGIVAALIIEDEDWYRGVKVLPYSSVIAIGDDAITITNSQNILQLSEATEYEPLLTANVRIIDTKAITKAGSIQGTVTEIFIDDDGKVAKCEVSAPDGEVSEISSEQVSIFGKQVTIIDSDVPERSAPAPALAAAPVAPEPEPAKKVEPQVQEPAAQAAPIPEPPKEKPVAPASVAAPAPAAAAAATQKSPEDKAQSDKAAEERHRRFLLGKKAGRKIATDNGIVIVEAGADITEEVLQKAKLANKFVELSMNIK